MELLGKIAGMQFGRSRFVQSAPAATVVAIATTVAALMAPSNASAAVSVLDVNTKLSVLTAPYNTADTAMSLSFDHLNIDSVRATDFAFQAEVSKKGADNEAKLTIDRAAYTYGDGTAPTAEAKVNLQFDLVKAFGQDMINSLADDLESIALEVAEDYSKSYGAALTVSATTEEKRVDANGNVELLKLHLVGKMDMSQLPLDKPVTEVEFQQIDVTVIADKAGARLDGKIVTNPLYKGYDSSGMGAKEYIEKFLAGDAATMKALGQYVAMLDSAANWLVKLKPDSMKMALRNGNLHGIRPY